MGRVTFHCRTCGRGVRSFSGLARHRCQVQQTSQRRRRSFRNNISTGLTTLQRVSLQSSLAAKGLPVHPHPTAIDTKNTNHLNDMQEVIIGDFSHRPTSANKIDKGEEEPSATTQDIDNNRQNEYGFILNSTGYKKRDTTLSEPITTTASTKATWYKEYKDDKDNGAAAVIDPSQILESEFPWTPSVIDPINPYAPFPSEHDWKLAAWFARAGCGKGDIEDYFANPSFLPPPDEEIGPYTMRSYNEYCRYIYKIPYGIPFRDEWKKKGILVPSQFQDGKPITCFLRYRPIRHCLEFLLGYAPFASDLTWSPVKKFHGRRDLRVYDKMHTANWWWEIQSKLLPGATVVPIILATDKTLMTQHRGDQTAWPTYITIGNLSRRMRRQQKLPSVILLALLPQHKNTTKGSDDNLSKAIKSQLYHSAMDCILDNLKTLGREGMLVQCADGNIRRCYPIIALMITDYKE